MNVVAMRGEKSVCVFQIYLCNRGIVRDLRQRLSGGMNTVAGYEGMNTVEEEAEERLRPIYETEELDELVSSRVFPRFTTTLKSFQAVQFQD